MEACLNLQLPKTAKVDIKDVVQRMRSLEQESATPFANKVLFGMAALKKASSAWLWLSSMDER